MYRSHNAVDYSAAPDLSLVRERNTIRQHAVDPSPILSSPESGYASNYSSIKLCMGNTEFMDGWTSYLNIRVAIQGNSQQGQYIQSFLNLIRQVTIQDKFGNEIERIEDVNILNSLILREMFGDAYFATSAKSLRDYATKPTDYAQGPPGLSTKTNADLGIEPRPTIFLDIESTLEYTPALLQDGSYNVLIPLALISPLFRTDNLLPPQLMHDCYIRIDWENAQKVFTQDIIPSLPSVVDSADVVTGGTYGTADFTYYSPVVDRNLKVKNAIPSYIIDNIAIFADVYTLQLELANEIQQEYMELGIPIKMLSYTKVIDASQIESQSSARLSIPINRSFSKASKLIASVKVEPAVSVIDTVNIQSIYPLFRGQPQVDNTKYSFRLNSQQYPNYPVENVDTSYWHWMQAFGKTRLYTDVRDSTSNNFYNENGTSFAVDFNRAAFSFRVSGSAISTESNAILSGQRIDGTNPCTLYIELPAMTDEQIINDRLPSDISPLFAATAKRRIYGWIEHERHVILNPQSNRVLL